MAESSSEVPHPEVPTEEDITDRRHSFQIELDGKFLFTHPDGTPFTAEERLGQIAKVGEELAEKQVSALIDERHDYASTGVIVPADPEDLREDLAVLARLSWERRRAAGDVVTGAQQMLSHDALLNSLAAKSWDREGRTVRELLGLPSAEENSASNTQSPHTTTPEEPTGQS